MIKARRSYVLMLLSVVTATSLLCNMGMAWSLVNRSVPSDRSLGDSSAYRFSSATEGSSLIKSPKPFHWSEIETDDFNSYIKKLREIGCPELTIQRLVSAELDDIYPESRPVTTPFQKQALQTMPIVPGINHISSVTSSPQKQQLMAALFPGCQSNGSVGTAGSGASFQAASDAVSQSQRAVSNGSAGLTQTKPATIPLALKESTSQLIPPNVANAQVMAGIRDEFVSNIGGPNQDPADLAYIQRWQIAQNKADAQLRAQLGKIAYNRLSIAAAQEAFAKAHPELSGN